MTQDGHTGPTEWRCHWISYGKLIDPDDVNGAIQPGFEHRVVGRSAGFPEDLRPIATLGTYVSEAPESGQALHKAHRSRGAFFGVCFLTDEGEYSVFARIRTCPEAGSEQGGRSFLQISALAVEADQWLPNLIDTAYEALFSSELGALRTEVDLEAPRPVLKGPVKRSVLQHAPANYGVEFSRGRRVPIKVKAGTMDDAVQAVTCFHEGIDLERESACLLPFALGLNAGVRGTEFGYCVGLETIEENQAQELVEDVIKQVPFPKTRPESAFLLKYRFYPWRHFWADEDRFVDPSPELIRKAADEFENCEDPIDIAALMPLLERHCSVPTLEPRMSLPEMFRGLCLEEYIIGHEDREFEGAVDAPPFVKALFYGASLGDFRLIDDAERKARVLDHIDHVIRPI